MPLRRFLPAACLALAFVACATAALAGAERLTGGAEALRVAGSGCPDEGGRLRIELVLDSCPAGTASGVCGYAAIGEGVAQVSGPSLGDLTLRAPLAVPDDVPQDLSLAPRGGGFAGQARFVLAPDEDSFCAVQAGRVVLRRAEAGTNVLARLEARFTAETLYFKGLELLRAKAGNPQLAVEHLEAAFALAGTVFRPLDEALARYVLALAKALGRAGEYERASALLKERLAGPLSPESRRLLGEALAAVRPTETRDFGRRGYNVVKVYYATDRKETGDASPYSYFGGKPGGELKFGQCEVAIPFSHKVGEVESPCLYKLELSRDPNKHVSILSLRPESREEFFAAMRKDRGGEREVVLFIHGYNVSFSSAIMRMGQLVYDLKFAGIPVVYSWPSGGSVIEYLQDGDKVQRSIPFLTGFIRLLAGEVGPTSIHIIAHSMGNRALVGAVQEIAREFEAPGRPKIRDIVLAAPDVDSRVFREQIAPHFLKAASNTTLYASSRDLALIVSRLYNKAMRLGDSDEMTIFRGMDSIDVSSVDSSLLGHSYYGDTPSILADIHSLLLGKKPEARPWLSPLRRPTGEAYWLFRPR